MKNRSVVLSFFACGDPQPQGSMRSFGGGRMTCDNKKLKPWRAAVVLAALRAIANAGGNWQKLNCPVRVELEFFVKRPSKPMFDEPATKPDLDKLVRAISDALTEAGVYADDSRVVSLSADAFYAGLARPGVAVRVLV